MSLQADIKPIQNFEITPETLEFTTGKDTRNISIKHLLCLRHVTPRTRLSQAILYENVSYARQLAMKMETLKADRLRNAKLQDFNFRAFKQMQEKKRQKWKRDDEVRLSNMNLPVKHLGSESDRPKSWKTMYRMSEFKPEGEKHEHPTPVLPKMNLTVHREQTEIISHREKTFLTRFPEVIEIDPKLIDRHNSYCGKELLEDGGSGRDARFHRFINALSPAKCDNNDYPIENLTSRSRVSKYSTKNVGATPKSSAKAVPRAQQAIKDDVAKRFQAIISRESTAVSDSSIFDSTDFGRGPREPRLKQGRFQKRGDYILETYRSDDIIQLGKKGPNVGKKIPETEEISD